jgi:drug/metabolite transporter (DMT)-like permease
VTGPVRLALLVALVMTAFAANSLLNRAGVGGGLIGALDFAAVRTVAGAAMLGLLVGLRGRLILPATRLAVVGALSLATYMVGFSLAYLRLDAGIGALILFGGVQLAMFAGGLSGGERPPARRWIGSALALAGLVWMFWPTHGVRIDLLAALAMGAAAVGWAVYSLNGRKSSDALGTTAATFLLAAPLCAAVALAAPDPTPATVRGVILAVLSGAVTSGLGYALWYRVLPRLSATAASLAQPSVPVIVLVGGALLLGEAVAPATMLAAALVLGGVAFGSLPGRVQRTMGSSGS